MAYTILGPNPSFGWHAYPVNLCCVTLGLMGLCAVSKTLKSPRLAKGILAGIGLLLIMYIGRATAFTRTSGGEYWWGSRIAAYRQAALQLRSVSREKDRVIALEVGTLGYYSRLLMHDSYGLVTLQPQKVSRDVRWAILVSHQLDDDKRRSLRKQVGNWRLWSVIRRGKFIVWIFALPPPPNTMSRRP